MEPRDLPEALSNPQLTPSDYCWTVLQDHGPRNGGWGPAFLKLPWLPFPSVFVYTGNDPAPLDVVRRLCRQMAQETGKPTRLVRFSHREDVAVFGGSS